MTKKINLIYLALALLTSTAVICTAQSWEDGSGSDWTNDGLNNGNSGGNNQNTESWGSPPPAEVSEPGDEAYFPVSISESSETLIDDTTYASYVGAPLSAQGTMPSSSWSESLPGVTPMMAGSSGSSKNIFWIVYGTKYRSSVNIPCGSYARLLIIPSTSGQLIMEELYPNGQVQTYYYGYVKAQKPYKKWFFADTSGIHRMRYRIDNGPYSDILTFHVGNCKGGGGHGVCQCCGRPF